MLNGLHLKIAIVAVVAFAAALATGTAGAVPDPNCVPNPLATPPASNISGLDACVHTFASVTNSNSPPVVMQKWELPDMDNATAGVQYVDNATAGGEQCILDPTTSTNTNTPCINDVGNDLPDKNTLQQGHFHHDADPLKSPGPENTTSGLFGGMVVEPNIDDKPSKRMIEIWAIVTDPVGGVGDIVSVQATVTCPGGSEILYPDVCPKKVSALDLTPALCDDLGDPLDSSSPRHAAENTGQLAHGKLDVQDCVQQAWRPYRNTFLLNNSQPWGKYETCIVAIDTQSNTSDPLCNFFTVKNVVAFKIDFVDVQYGTISPSVPKSVSPGNIENTGNADACVTVTFSEMKGKDFQNFITGFDAELKGEILDIVADDTVLDEPTNGLQFVTPLTSKVPQKIRFSIKPPAVLAEDLYQGTVDLSVKKCPGA